MSTDWEGNSWKTALAKRLQEMKEREHKSQECAEEEHEQNTSAIADDIQEVTEQIASLTIDDITDIVIITEKTDKWQEVTPKNTKKRQ